MEFGISLIGRGPLATPEILTRTVQTAERLGFHSVTVSDHIVIPRSPPTNYPYHPQGEFPWEAARNYLEPLATLMYLAGKTSRIRLGTSVLIVSYRNPVTTAKMLSTIDMLSGGRIFLGVGTGWWADEYAALGIPSHFAERGPRTDEYLRIYKTLWNDENPEFEGKFHRFGNLEFSPKPVQPGGIPIWVGGHTNRALRRTVELGDAWHPIGQRPPADLSPAELGEKVLRLRAMAEKAGRDPDSIGIALRAQLIISETESRPLVGSLAQVVDDIHGYLSRGVTHVTFDIPAESEAELMERLEQAGREILPQFS